jgi:serine/threonine-protein kinase
MQNISLVGARLGKYEVRAELGRGGMGTVYRAYDPTLDRPVAVKVLAPHLVWDREFVERFLREAQAAARLKHPNIVTIYDVGQESGWYYFVMEYLEGQPLTEVLQLPESSRGSCPAKAPWGSGPISPAR